MNNMRDGYGLQIWPDGAKYIGFWVQNKAHGQGKFDHVDGDVYDGEVSCNFFYFFLFQDYDFYGIFSGDKIKRMGLVFTYMLLELFIAGNGKMICNAERE